MLLSVIGRFPVRSGAGRPLCYVHDKDADAYYLVAGEVPEGSTAIPAGVKTLSVFGFDAAGDVTAQIASLDTADLEDTGGAAAAGTGVVLEESQGITRAVLTLTNVHVPMVDNAGVVAYGSLKVLDFPAGLICFLGASMDLAITKSSAGVNADWDGDIGLGSVAANSGNALATTEQDFIPTTPTPQAVAGVATGDGESTGTEAPKIFNGTATAVDMYLNVIVDDADHDVTSTPCDLIFNGTITLAYVKIGDN